MMGVRETVMDYGHIWAVISRSLSAAAFSRREKSCIMVSHGRPGSLGCIMPCQRVHLVITGFTAQSRIKTALCGSRATVLKGITFSSCTASAENYPNHLRLLAETSSGRRDIHQTQSKAFNLELL